MDEFEIRDSEEEIIGYGIRVKENFHVTKSNIDKIVNARNQNLQHFFDHSKSSIDSTLKFLKSFEHDNSKKELYLVFKNLNPAPPTLQSEILGHLGYSQDGFGDIEIINVMKIHDESKNQVMFYALKALVLFLRKSFPKAKIYLQVLEENKKAKNFYTRLGFLTDSKCGKKVDTMYLS